MVYRENITWRQIHRPTNVSQIPGGLVSASKPKFQYLHGSQFWIVCLPQLSGAGWSPWDVLPAVLDMIIPEGSASAGSLSTGGTGVEAFVCSTPTTHVSHPALCWNWWVINSSYAGSCCTLPHPWGIPHKLVHWDRPLFHYRFPVLPSVLYWGLLLAVVASAHGGWAAFPQFPPTGLMFWLGWCIPEPYGPNPGSWSTGRSWDPSCWQCLL